MAEPNDDRASFLPEGWRRVTPRMVCRDSERLVAFIKHVFGATGEPRQGGPTVLAIGDSMVMVSEAEARAPMTAFLYVYVEDTDAAYRRALASGAHSLEQPVAMPYGDRRCMVEDPWGNTWQIATHLAAR